LKVQMMARTLHTRLPLGPAAGVRARRSLESFRPYLDRHSFEALRLLVTELVNNSLKHSGRPEGDPIDLRVEVAAGRVRAEVVDQGTAAPVIHPGDDGHRESGWGLFLLDRLAEDWGFTSGGPTRVWFEMSTRPGVRPLLPWPSSQAGTA
jgi:anti-sigma regulatory factor (Ser/Thr protein kinase)